MRLEKIEINGFKSFADKTVMHFDRAVTGVVGPNGSGKSNVVDAIRWVLGEQKSTQLRLERMEDVIFNGTKKRKKAQRAKVSLFFQNDQGILPIEYSLVEISRELLRSGMSQYQINGVNCRLKDIRSLLADSGIGPDSYAIIALQMVESILHDSQGDRRRMLEQAAGIAKYKMHKRQTEQKLAQTMEDLVRVDDLLGEIQANLKELEKQAKRAAKFRKIQFRYKEMSIALLRNKWEESQEKRKNLEKEIEGLLDNYQKLTKDKHVLSSFIESEGAKLMSIESTLSERQRNQAKIKEEIAILEGRIEQNRTKKELSSKQLTRIEQQLQIEVQEMDNIESELSLKEEELSENLAELHRLKELVLIEGELKTKKEEHYQKNKQKNASILPHYRQLEQELFNLEKEKAVWKNKQENILKNRETYKANEDALKQQISALTDKKAIIEKELIELESLNLQNEKTAAERDQRHKKLQETYYSKSQEISSKQRSLDARENELELMKAMMDKLEGFPESIRFLNGKDHFNQSAPLFTDLINCNPEYQSILEKYLHGYLNYFVVLNDDEANKAVQLLRDAQKGQASFFVLNKLSDAKEFENLEPAKKAKDVIECDDRYRKLIDKVLDRVYLFEDDQFGGRKPQDGETFLCYTSDKIYSSYSIQGGSQNLFSGQKIGRKKRIEALNSSLQKLNVGLVKSEKQRSKIKAEMASLETVKESGEAEKLRTEIVKLTARLDNLKASIGSLESRKSNELLALEELEVQWEKSSRRILETKELIFLKQEEVKKAREEIDSIDFNTTAEEKELEILRRSFNELEMRKIKSEGLVDRLQGECGYRKSRLNQLGLNQGKLENETAELEINLNQIELNLKQASETLSDLLESKRSQANLVTDQEEKYYALKSQIDQNEKELKEIERKAFEHQSLINLAKEKASSVRFGQKAIEDSARLEFKVELSELSSIELETSIVELEISLGKLRSRIENYGEINALAETAYKEMEQRVVEISKHKEDILAAKKSLVETIQELDEQALFRFKEAFEQVNIHFRKVFRSLFNADDDCSLVLVDPENPLESKIELVAKPKSKRPRTLSQLSGGEKTLTAIAFLFGMYLLKPAPFCIFDEVDAPLDDVNIKKFNKIIREFSTDSSFIIITHNKMTMTAMDIVYGVFMDKPGVSQIGAVDFNEINYAASA